MTTLLIELARLHGISEAAERTNHGMDDLTPQPGPGQAPGPGVTGRMQAMSVAALKARGPHRNDYYDRGCSLGRWAKTLPDEERSALEIMLADPEWTHSEIAEQIATDTDYPGVAFRGLTVGRHRRGECGCERH